MRLASQAGTRPPWSGRSATPERFTCSFSHRRRSWLQAYQACLDHRRRLPIRFAKPARQPTMSPVNRPLGDDENQGSMRPSCPDDIVVIATIKQKGAHPMFETFAVISTISCIVIFVVLYRVDQSGRREEAGKAEGRIDPRP
jgi:hypothetical protein